MAIQVSSNKLTDLTTFKLAITLDHGGLGRFQQTVKASKHGHREHDTLILGRAIRSAQKISNGPNKI